jgi:hypothetical protein
MRPGILPSATNTATSVAARTTSTIQAKRSMNDMVGSSHRVRDHSVQERRRLRVDQKRLVGEPRSNAGTLAYVNTMHLPATVGKAAS